jgi:hypothetical protein
MSEIQLFLIGFAFNLLIAFVLVRFIYYPSTHNKRYVFTFMAFNTVIYFVLSFLTSIELSIGAGFGLFAIFTILRYRTDPLPVREMTYLFIVVALPVMNSVSADSTLWPQLLAANTAVLIIMFILEKGWGFRYETSKQIVYEKIELIRPDRYAELKADLEDRTGLSIKKITLGKVNFLKDTANISIYYDAPREDGWADAETPTLLIGNNSAEMDD